MFTDTEAEVLAKKAFRDGWETALSAIKYGVISEDNKETLQKHYTYYEKQCIMSLLKT